ncbi:hypothetical protein OKW96_02220 [Sphingobacterium sp. KU25419]|nr:hypothetical protein OKW96_02220 [Sphingobacterium sp. KU25419]
MSFVLFASTSCKDFLDVNVNPNSPIKENLSLNAKLPAALVTSAAYEATQLNLIGGLGEDIGVLLMKESVLLGRLKCIMVQPLEILVMD